MELISEDAKKLFRIISMLKDALMAAHMTGVTRQREDKRRQAAAHHLAIIRANLLEAIESMERAGSSEIPVVYKIPRIPSIKPRIRERGKKHLADVFSDD